MSKKFKSQIFRVYIHIINSVQRSLLGDDIISIKIRMFLLWLLGVRYGKGTKVLGGSEILGHRLKLGSGITVNRSCYFDLTGNIVIEDNVGIGHGVTFITAEHKIGPRENRAGHHHPGHIFGKNILLKKGCWIAANVTIMPGVTVGEGAIVAAGALVNRDVSPNTIVAGLPAKPIRILTDDN